MGSSEDKLQPKIIGSKLGSPMGSGLRSGLGSGSAGARLGTLELLGFVRHRIGSGICARLAEIGARLGTQLFSDLSDPGRVSGLALFGVSLARSSAWLE